ncbi:uncharacterized protein LOC6728454 [Drosophila simulans]|uniref:GD18788 n=1 Tax=Drosophila simulans TaxID=7240 RepID=B4QTJ7_DROSI|nr:uncharacterized protein LOC6728454 [Drosophila simulans]EDX13302.1 GD18788 [Drosophila simulans]KMZ04125.1 uncharacterized protein Dsimw501_GD18788 [Drosophila simulans]
MGYSQLFVELKKNCFSLILMCIILYVLISFREEVEHKMIVQPPVEGKPDNRMLFVNSSQCQINSMDPLSPMAMYHMTPLPSVGCSMIKLLKPQSIDGRNYLYLIASAKELWKKLGVRRLSDIFCAYKRFVRFNDFVNIYYESTWFRFTKWRNFTKVDSGNVTLRVWCWMDYGRLVYHDVFIFLPFPNPEKVNNSAPVKRLSVLILGIDSISHMHYQRYFSRVKDLIEGLPHTELWGYNRVGQNSYPNLIPLLSGQSVEEVEAKSGCFGGNRRANFDRCHLLWHDFQDAGYATIFGEDSRVAGTFTYVRPGFKKRPTDFYLRSVINEIHMKSTYYARGPLEIKCSGDRVYHHVLYDFIYRLLPHMQTRMFDRGFFAFFWQTMGVHDYFQYGERADWEYYRIMRALKRRKILERTLVLIVSDHGLRYGPFVDTFQGMRETSLPTMVAIYPRSVMERFPLAFANLEANAHRLVTTYDLHETIKDVVDLENLSDERILNRTLRLRNDHNVSLFLPIPEERSCFSARIPLHYCQCDGFVKIPWNAHSIQRIAKLAVARINRLLATYPQCHQLELLNVEDAYLRKQHKLNKTITVRLVTQPGNGHFDATVLSKNETSLQGAITRTDQYRHQSFCAREAPIEIYCYCS